MPTHYDLVKGPQGDAGPAGYNTKWEDAERAAATTASQTFRTGVAANAGDTITLNVHGLQNGTRLVFGTVVTGITTGAIYYVVGAAANTFQIATTPGGSAVAIGADGNVTFAIAPKALVGTPLTPAHYFDSRDGAVTAPPVLVTA